MHCNKALIDFETKQKNQAKTIAKLYELNTYIERKKMLRKIASYMKQRLGPPTAIFYCPYVFKWTDFFARVCIITIIFFISMVELVGNCPKKKMWIMFEVCFEYLIIHACFIWLNVFEKYAPQTKSSNSFCLNCGVAACESAADFIVYAYIYIQKSIS